MQNDRPSLKPGLDWTGLDWTGLDWTGLDWTGLDWTGLNFISDVHGISYQDTLLL